MMLETDRDEQKTPLRKAASAAYLLMLIIGTGIIFLAATPQTTLAANCEETAPGVTLIPTFYEVNGEVVPACQTDLNVHYIYNEDGVLVEASGAHRPFSETGGLQNPPKKGGCSLTNPGGWIEHCLWGSIVVAAGTLLLGIGMAILGVAGALFDFLIFHTIIQFGHTISAEGTFPIIEGINSVWGGLRDIANIVIIGMFVFVAFATILNIQEYGVKKMIARLLIVAVLINFSLFFAKFTIDASHFLAKQFYDAQVVEGLGIEASAADPSLNTHRPDSQTTSFAEDGIASSFMEILGISSVGDVVTDLYGLDAAKSDWGLSVILYSLLSFILLLALAAVFLYGSFVLVSRAILLVFLMITSALAFAAHLVPAFSKHKYGWEGWWDALLRSALLAPMLLLFLWASLKVLEPLQANQPDASFGEALSNPVVNLGSIALTYVFVIGLLYLSIRLASSLSSSITGFNIAATVPGLGVALGSRMIGRSGRLAAGWNQRRAERRAADEKRRTGRISEKTMRKVRRADSLAGRSFDPMANKAIQNLIKNTGLPKGVADKLTKPQKGGATADRKEAFKKEQDRVQRRADIEGTVDKERLQQAAVQSKTEAVQVKDQQQPIIEQHQTNIETTKDRIRQVDRDRDVARTRGDDREIERLNEEERYHEQNLRQEEQRLKEAQKVVAERRKQAEADEELAKGDATTKAAERIANEGAPSLRSRIRRRAYGMSNEELSKSMRKKATSEGSKKRFKEIFGEDVEAMVKNSEKESDSS